MENGVQQNRGQQNGVQQNGGQPNGLQQPGVLPFGQDGPNFNQQNIRGVSNGQFGAAVNNDVNVGRPFVASLSNVKFFDVTRPMD